MDFTQYSQIISYPQLASAQSVMDIMGCDLESGADRVVHIHDSLSQVSIDRTYDGMLFRFALSCIDDPFDYLSTALSQLKSGGYVILQDFLMPDNQQVADYINGFIHIFDKNHRKSFAQYEWNGLLLDVGLRIDASHQRTIHNTIQMWQEYYQPDVISNQHAQIILVQAPEAVKDTMQISYAGTPYAEFVLQEFICIAQKES
jgi:hypothetical protein